MTKELEEVEEVEKKEEGKRGRGVRHGKTGGMEESVRRSSLVKKESESKMS